MDATIGSAPFEHREIQQPNARMAFDPIAPIKAKA
jgi:hypothetical protein